MTKKKYAWQINKTPPNLDPHSVVKHKIIDEYLKTYVAVLTARPQLDRLRITLVDGFCGGGLYLGPKKERRPGSPLIMLGSIAHAEAIARSWRTKRFQIDADYFFIDQDRAACGHLAHILKQSEYRSQNYEILNSSFEETAGPIIAQIERRVRRQRGGRSIFVLDQYGYRDVPFSILRSILGRLPNAEVILTLSVDALVNYLGDNDASRNRLESLGIDLSLGALEEAKAQQPNSWRRIIQHLLHEEFFRKSGARFYTPFFVRNPDSHRAYWLIHLSNHHRARDVMTALHWANSNDFLHYGKPGLQMLGYNPNHDELVTGQRLMSEFRFDSAAKTETTVALLQDLPRFVAEAGDGLSFDQLFARVTNETPATSDILKSIVKALSQDHEFKIYDEYGSRRRRSSEIQNSDRIVRSNQLRLFCAD